MRSKARVSAAMTLANPLWRPARRTAQSSALTPPAARPGLTGPRLCQTTAGSKPQQTARVILTIAFGGGPEHAVMSAAGL